MKPEILKVFLSESEEIIAELSNELEKEACDTSLALRSVHTLKGNFGMADSPVSAEFFRLAELLLKADKFNKEASEILKEGLAFTQKIVEQSRKTGLMPDESVFFEELKVLTHNLLSFVPAASGSVQESSMNFYKLHFSVYTKDLPDGIKAPDFIADLGDIAYIKVTPEQKKLPGSKASAVSYETWQILIASKEDPETLKEIFDPIEPYSELSWEVLEECPQELTGALS